MQHLQCRKLRAFIGGWPAEADHNTTLVRKRRKSGDSRVKGRSGNPQVHFNKSFAIEGENSRSARSTLVFILLSGRNTCVGFAPVAMASAKCSAEVTSVRVYERRANLKILFLRGGEINILSKCWKWEGPLHVSKQNPRDKGSVTASLCFISISGTLYRGSCWRSGCNCTNPRPH